MKRLRNIYSADLQFLSIRPRRTKVASGKWANNVATKMVNWPGTNPLSKNWMRIRELMARYRRRKLM